MAQQEAPGGSLVEARVGLWVWTQKVKVKCACSNVVRVHAQKLRVFCHTPESALVLTSI